MPTKLTEDATIPPLEGWMKLVDAGTELGVSRQHISRMAIGGAFKTLHRIGEGERALFIVRTEEVNELKTSRT